MKCEWCGCKFPGHEPDCEWVASCKEASARMHAEHPRSCAIWTTTGKCTCEETA